MPIPLSCPCGRAFNIKDECAGHKIRCPQCKSILKVPLPKKEEELEEFDLEVIEEDETEEIELEVVEEEEEVLEVLPAETPSRRSAIQATPSAKRPARLSSSEDDDRVRISRRRDEDDDPRPKRRRPKLRREEARDPAISFEKGWFGSVNAGVVGGGIMLLIGGVWLICGLAVGILFFKPVFLIIVGIIAILKGMFN